MEDFYSVRVSGESHDGPVYAQDEFTSLEEAQEFQWEIEHQCYNWLYFSVITYKGEEVK